MLNVCFQLAIHVVVQPHTPLFFPGKLLPSQLFWFHVSTFLLIISRCCCQISPRPIFKSGPHLETRTTFCALIPCTLAGIYCQGLSVGLSAAFPCGSIQMPKKSAACYSTELPAPSCVLQTLQVQQPTKKSELFLVDILPRPQCWRLSNLGCFLTAYYLPKWQNFICLQEQFMQPLTLWPPPPVPTCSKSSSN